MTNKTLISLIGAVQKIYITTWDITGEGMYRGLSPNPSHWDFSGGEADGAKILDSVELVIQ
ncbi:MAG: hypothetical protein VW882_10480, partial [Gammaproteobacteria bacterium]